MHFDQPVFVTLAVPKEPMGSLHAVIEGAVCRVLHVQGNCDMISHVVAEGSEHLMIVAEHGSCATVFLSVTGGQCVVEAFVAERATLHIVCVQKCSGTPISVTLKSRTESGGSIYWHTVTLGDEIAQQLSSVLAGANARSDIDCLFCVNDTDRQTLTVLNDFQAQNGSGEIHMRGIAERKGYASCTGKILIGEAGRGTDTYLTQDVLMLDTTAKVDAVPGLEIRTNDVKASHSATVSRVTEEDLFYFASRGLDECTARPMFIDGFLQEALTGIPNENVRNSVGHIVRQRSMTIF